MSELLDLGPNVKCYGSSEGNSLTTTLNAQNIFEAINAQLILHPRTKDFTIFNCIATHTSVENHYEVTVGLSGQKTGPGADVYALKLFKNDTQALPGRDEHEYSKAGVDAGLRFTAIVDLKEGDTIEPKITSTTGSDNFDVVNIHMTIREWI